MTIEALWQQMESETDAGPAWRVRVARPQTGFPLRIGLEAKSGARALLIPQAEREMPPRREWPDCRGVDVSALRLDAQACLCVRLRDRENAGVFTALAEDVSSRLSASDGAKRATEELFTRLKRWQQFLAAAQNSLSLEEQRGLWGELYLLRTHLLPNWKSAAVEAWKASDAAHQDFQVTLGAIEVKTTAAKQPQSIRITSERQLDSAGVGKLFLHVIAVDERDVSPAGVAPGESLPDLIAELRSRLAVSPLARLLFDDRLLERAWLDASASRFQSRRWTVRHEQSYEVRSGFPRLLESDLPAGIGDVSYALSLAACGRFAVPAGEMLSALSPAPLLG